MPIQSMATTRSTFHLGAPELNEQTPSPCVSEGDLEYDIEFGDVLENVKGEIKVQIVYADPSMKQFMSVTEFKKADVLVNDKQIILEANAGWRQMKLEDLEFAEWLNEWNEHRKKTLDFFKKSRKRAWKHFMEAY